MTLKLLAEATGLVADLQGPDVEARVQQLRAETSAVRRSETAVARRGLAILDRVVAEMEGLRLVEDERLEPFAGEVAAEVLGLDPDGLAGMIEADLEQGRCTDPGRLEGMIATRHPSSMSGTSPRLVVGPPSGQVRLEASVWP
jgi:hypothetical protein